MRYINIPLVYIYIYILQMSAFIRNLYFSTAIFSLRFGLCNFHYKNHQQRFFLESSFSIRAKFPLHFSSYITRKIWHFEQQSKLNFDIHLTSTKVGSRQRVIRSCSQQSSSKLACCKRLISNGQCSGTCSCLGLCVDMSVNVYVLIYTY